MTTFFLARHGAHGRLGRYLDGRRPGVHLGEDGRRQADWLGRRLAGESVSAVLSSPMERARETAAPIAAALGLAVEVTEGLNEIDFGDWSGQEFEALRPREDWRIWHATRSTAPTPSGDSMRAVQARVLDLIDERRSAEGAVVLVSHADPIKAALAWFLGLSLDDLGRFEIAPGSLSRVEVEPWGPRVILVNETGRIAAA